VSAAPQRDWLQDPALSLGWSVFETVGVSPSGALLELDLHLERLKRSAEWLGRRAPARAELEARLKRAAELAALELDPEATSPQLIALRYTLSVSGRDQISHRLYSSDYIGSKLRVAPLLAPASPYLPRSVKHSCRAEWRAAARTFEVDEVLLCDERGELLEADQSSLCALHQGRLIYPPLSDGRRLKSVGLTRLLRCAAELGLPSLQSELHLTDDHELLLLCSSLKGAALAHLVGEGDPRLSECKRGLVGQRALSEVSAASVEAWGAILAQLKGSMGLS